MDEIVAISALDAAGTLTGAEITVIVQGGETVRTNFDTIAAYVASTIIVSGGGVEVTNPTRRNALKLNSNWVNPLSPTDQYYGIMTANEPTGQSEHDYYWGHDSATNSFYRYQYEKVDGVFKWTRTLSAYNVPTA